MIEQAFHNALFFQEVPQMKDALLASLLGTANNVVNQVAADRQRQAEKEKAIAREQEETKRIIAQEEEKTRREFVEKGLDKKHRDAIKELQKKREEHPINTVCPACTGTMEVDRKKGMITCPYCEHTEVLDPVHCYDPILDDPNYFKDLQKTAASMPVNVEVKKPDNKPAVQNGVTVEKLNVRPNKSFSNAKENFDPDHPTTKITYGNSVLKDQADISTAPPMQKVAAAAKLIDTQPIEDYAKLTAKKLILPIISLICGLLAMMTCGLLVVPEVVGLVSGFLAMIAGSSKSNKVCKILAVIGFLLSLSSVAALMLNIFIFRK